MASEASVRGEAEAEGPARALPDADRPALAWPRRVVSEVFAHARECYPEECCGLLIGGVSGEVLLVVRCTNVQSRRFARGESELDARHGFWIDEREQIEALRAAERRGERLVGVYHSHVDSGAYLSDADLQGALGPDGAPLWPGAAQVVVGVGEGGVREAAVFDWDAGEGCFRGRRLVGDD